ncbi:MAG: hypothetical protein LBJ41_01805 [Treponema sp.]|jgi:hypothetical protein|nr:hypothetical protein [Treponema sp.]
MSNIEMIDIKMSDMGKFREVLYATMESMGMKPISDDFCCRILAYLYVYGGGNEQVIFNDRLRTDIFEAQKRLGLNHPEGDNMPNVDLLPVLKEYIKSITGGNEYKFWFENREYDTPPEWVIEFEKRYKIKPAYRRRITNDIRLRPGKHRQAAR